MSPRPVFVIAALTAAFFALAGCATAEPGGAAPVGGQLDVDAAWLDGGSTIALVTQGSSSCVPTATDVALQVDGSLAVTLTDPDGAACTRDLVPRASLVGVPEGVDPTKELELTVAYGDATGETDLDGYEGGPVEEYTPSAGWVDDGLFAVLTWGSSSCAPVVESVTAEGDAVTVVFVTPADDQVCTMDMAPRVALAAVDGVDDDSATVTLTGGGAEFATPVTVPIS